MRKEHSIICPACGSEVAESHFEKHKRFLCGKQSSFQAKSSKKSTVEKTLFSKQLRQKAKIAVGLAKTGDEPSIKWLEENWKYGVVRNAVKRELDITKHPNKYARITKSKPVRGSHSVQGGAPSLGKKR